LKNRPYCGKYIDSSTIGKFASARLVHHDILHAPKAPSAAMAGLAVASVLKHCVFTICLKPLFSIAFRDDETIEGLMMLET
jgi:hypothetical protein